MQRIHHNPRFWLNANLPGKLHHSGREHSAEPKVLSGPGGESIIGAWTPLLEHAG